MAKKRVKQSQYRKRLSLLQVEETKKKKEEINFQVTIPQAVITSAGVKLPSFTNVQ